MESEYQGKTCYLLVCGFVKKKPALWTFLRPHINALKELELDVEFESPSGGKFFL